MLQSTSEIASMLFGAFGVGGGVVALYIRGTIADTIISKLDARYTGTRLCDERHATANDQLVKIEHQADKIDNKVQIGFDSLRAQLLVAQISQAAVASDTVNRELSIRGKLVDREHKVDGEKT